MRMPKTPSGRRALAFFVGATWVILWSALNELTGRFEAMTRFEVMALAFLSGIGAVLVEGFDGDRKKP